MKFFNRTIGIRLRKKELEAISELIEKYPEKYSSRSHIVRCALIELLNLERRIETLEAADLDGDGYR